MSLKLYTPGPEGGLEPAPEPPPQDYRERLSSRRWGSAELKNPEVHKTNPAIALLFIGAIAVATFLIIVAGYTSGFWG